MSRNAVSARKRKQKINPEDLAPGIAEGLTQGIPAKEALETFRPHQIRPLEERVGHMHDQGRVPGTKLRNVRFVAEPNGQVITDGTGRRMQDVDIIVQPEVQREMQSGYKCLRCHEPQVVAFPQQCDLCGYPMAERQIMDCAMEFEGSRHVGPKKPINEYLEEQDARVEKRAFIQRVLEGGQGKVPKAWLRDATLLEGLTPDERYAIGDR